MKLLIAVLMILLAGQAFSGTDKPLPGECVAVDGNFCANASLDIAQVAFGKPAPKSDIEALATSFCAPIFEDASYGACWQSQAESLSGHSLRATDYYVDRDGFFHLR